MVAALIVLTVFLLAVLAAVLVPRPARRRTAAWSAGGDSSGYIGSGYVGWDAGGGAGGSCGGDGGGGGGSC